MSCKKLSCRIFRFRARKFHNLHIQINLIFLCCLFVGLDINAQTDTKVLGEIENFRQAYQNADNDTIQLFNLTRMAQRYRFVNTDTSKYYLRKAIALHKTKNVDKFNHAFAYNVIGDIFRLENNVDSMRYYYEEAYHLFSQDQEIQTIKALMAIAPTYGNFLVKNKEVEKGISVFQESIDHAINIKDYANLSFLYSYLGDVFFKFQKDNKHAIQIFKKGIAACKSVDNETNRFRALSSIYLGMSNIYLDEQQIDSTIIYAHKVIESAPKGRARKKVVIAYNNLCQGNILLGQFEKARKYNLEAERLNTNIKNLTAVIHTKLLSQSLDLHFDEYAKSSAVGEHLLNDYYSVMDNEMKETLFQNLLEAYIQTGNKTMALAAKDSLSYYSHLIHRTKHSASLASMYDEIEINEQKAKNDLIKLEQVETVKRLKIQRIAALGLFVALIFAIGLMMNIFRSSRERKKYNEELEGIIAERTKELQKANTDLTQTNNELRTLTFIASHDIKEPIRNIGNFAGLIKHRLPKDLQAKFDPEFGIIKRSARQLYTLIEDFSKFINLSKTDEVSIEEVDLNDVISDIESNISSNDQYQNAKIIYSELPEFNTNRTALYFILKNVIENALKYNKSEQPTAELSFKDSKDRLEITVADNGIGIPLEYQDKIFEMFKRLQKREDFESSGIGLSIVKLLTTKLDGTVSVHSQPGNGSQFILSFPKKKITELVY